MLPTPVNWTDPRLKVGAYITDGNDLYEVTGTVRVPGAMGGTYRIEVENSRSLKTLQLLPDRIRTVFDLVRAAPTAEVPEAVDQIAWDGEAVD